MSYFEIIPITNRVASHVAETLRRLSKKYGYFQQKNILLTNSCLILLLLGSDSYI